MARSDQELIDAYVTAACRESLDELVTRHLPRVRALVQSMLLDDASTDDVTQEIFLRAVRGLRTFQHHSQFRTWLYRITLNTAYSYLEQRQRTPRTSSSVGDILDRTPHRAPAEQVLCKELHSEIEAALATLTPKLRAAVVLVCLEGLSAADAARIEDCAASTISWRVHQARSQLEQRLGQYLRGT